MKPFTIDQLAKEKRKQRKDRKSDAAFRQRDER